MCVCVCDCFLHCPSLATCGILCNSLYSSSPLQEEEERLVEKEAMRAREREKRSLLEGYQESKMNSQGSHDCFVHLGGGCQLVHWVVGIVSAAVVVCCECCFRGIFWGGEGSLIVYDLWPLIQ